MRILVKAALAFLFVTFAAGLLPVSALHLDRLAAMKAELAAVRDPGQVRLRPSLTR